MKTNLLRLALTAVVVGLPMHEARAQTTGLDENCIVSVLNRNTRVQPDGTWGLPNIPANFGLVRARATCIFDGVTVSGESEPFLVPANGSVDVPPIVLGPTTPIPSSLQLTASPSELKKIAQTSQVTALAHYRDGSTNNVTAGGSGTLYGISNPAIATISANGVVTALASGTVLVQATHEGTSGFTSIRVVLGGDTDGDGIPDDLELSLGLNPNNAADALEDRDRDALNNRDETFSGTSLDIPDTDGDGLLDGEETRPGADGFTTNPLLADTDSDGVRDALEVTTGSDPTNPLSLNLGKALKGLTVTPDSFAIVINSVQGEGFRQLMVSGALQDGTTIDLSSTARGTNYQSSDLSVCNFGSIDGRVFGGDPGPCTITISNSGHSATAQGTVTAFAPVALSSIPIPGFANDIEISGNLAYVAAGAAGLLIIDVTNRAAPAIVGTLDTAGNANGIALVGSSVFVADGPSGLQIVDVANPVVPVIVGTFNTPGDAWDVVVRDNRAYIADGVAGLRIVDVTNGSAPLELGSIDPAGTQKGVDVDPARRIAVIASGTNGLHVIDVANPGTPVLRGTLTGGDFRDVALKGTFAYLADFQNSLTAVDLADPENPLRGGSTSPSLGGLLNDVTVQGAFALGADVFFANGVPIVNIDRPEAPIVRDILDFSSFRDDEGQAIASDGSFLYLVADAGGVFTENGATGNSRLYIGQYLSREDRQGSAPAVAVVSPPSGSTVVENENLSVRVEATDDVAVASVSLVLNGALIGTDTSAPYEFSVTVPIAVSAFTLEATALDFGDNLGTTAPVTLNVIADPLTTVVGRVVDRNGNGLAGVLVSTVGDHSSVSQSNGAFSIAGVPTTQASVSASARLVTGGGVELHGTSAAVSVVRGGTTDVGNISLSSGTTYYGYNPTAQGGLRMTGWTNGTTFTVTNLASGALLGQGTVNRFQFSQLDLPAGVRFKVEATNPLLATLGHPGPDCCAFGGSLFYPAIDGQAFVGREFLVRMSVLNFQNEFVIFAHEASTVTIANAAGTVVTTQTIPAGEFWATVGAPLQQGVVYRIQSTGDVAVQSNARNAYTAVPSADGDDTGTSFMFATRVHNSIGAAVFAYENTTVTATSLISGRQAFRRDIPAGQFFFFTSFGDGADEKIRLASTGKLSLWAGSMEGTQLIEWLGDDATVTVGEQGRDLFVHTQSQGGVLFATENATTVSVNGTVHTLNRDQFINFTSGQFLHITADKPVMVQTIGGPALNDWEFALRGVRR